MHLRIWGATDIGLVRKRNDDTFIVDTTLGLAVVADGIGGQHRGDIAATIACRAVREHLGRHQRDLEAFRIDPVSYKRDRVEDRVREAVQTANSEVFHTGEALSHGRGMGCTLEATLIVGGTAFIAHVGDARTYAVSRGVAKQITEDHSVIAEKVRRGLLTPEQAKKAAGRNLITRAVGALPSIRVDTLHIPFEAGDRLVLVSDGVTRYVDEGEIGLLVSADSPRGAEEVVALAKARGGVDNITAVVVARETAAPTPIAARDLDELRHSWLLESCTARELRAVAQVVEYREVRAGRVLFREGLPGDELFIVLHGEVTITLLGQTLATAVRGDVVGEMALLDAPTRSATALVTANAKLVVLSRHRFDQLLRQDDAVATRILSALVTRLSALVRQQNAKLVPR